MSPKYTTERVLSVHHWTDELFTITCTRSAGFKFANGQFAMIGLEVDGLPLTRAYSMASANYEETLEFFSIKVQNGPLTSRLQHIQVGDPLLVGVRATGTLTLANLRPGKTLWMLATGTGLAPFLSIVKDPETYERFDRVVLTHTCRHVTDLAYSKYLGEELVNDEVLGEFAKGKFVYYPTVTRDEFKTKGRITELMESGQLFRDLHVDKFDPRVDRVMICGSHEMNRDTARLLEGYGLEEGNSGEPGDYLVEKAFVTK